MVGGSYLDRRYLNLTESGLSTPSIEVTGPSTVLGACARECGGAARVPS